MNRQDKNQAMAYKQYNKEVNRAVAIAKVEVYDQLFNKLETKRGKAKDFN